MLVYENLPAPYSGAILFLKVNVGLDKLIDKRDWAKMARVAGAGQ